MWLAGGWAGSGRVGVGWSVTGTLVFLVSIGPDLTFRLFFDGMLGNRRCAGGVGIISSMVGPDYSVILQARNPKMMRCQQPGVVMVRKRETGRKASTVGERVAMVVPPETE